MRERLELTYIKDEVNQYLPKYLMITFEDKNKNKYQWNVTADSKEFSNICNYQKGDKVILTTTIEENLLKRVKIG